MSVVKISLQSGRNASFGKLTEHKSKLRWIGVTNNNFDTEVDLANYGYSNSILPIPFVSFHPHFATQLCRNIDFSQDARAPRKWEIEATYSSEPLGQKDQEQVENPTERPPDIVWKSQSYRRAVEKDRNGKACVNSAGDYFDPPLEVDSSRWVVTIEKNVTAVPTFILEYTDAINENSFAIQGITVQPEVAKIMDLNISSRKTEGEFVFYTFSYSMEFRPETWQVKALDQGMRYADLTDRKQILDDSTPPKPITTPKLLDGSGQVLNDPSPETAVFLDFDVLTPRDFTVLPGITELEE